MRTAHVIGGGIGGMATAGCLALGGWKVVVHERSTVLREVGAGIYLKENGLRVLERLGCFDSITAEGTRIRTSEILDRNCRPLLSRGVGGERVYTVLREHLHRELVKAALRIGVEVETGSEAVSVDPDGNLEVTGGKRYRADLIVGADGQRSVVRRQAELERSAVVLNNGSTRILTPWKAGDPADGSFEIWRGHKRVLVVPAGVNTTYICASSREDDAAAIALPFNRELWSELFPSLADTFARVDPHSAIHHAHGKVRVNGWHRGRIAIVGDAVHGQPPNLGQGAGMAIANGGSLADHLARTADIGTALADWERADRRLTEQVQQWSEQWDTFVHYWPLALESWRSAVIWSLANFPPTRRHWGRLYRGGDLSDFAQPVAAEAPRPAE